MFRIFGQDTINHSSRLLRNTGLPVLFTTIIFITLSAQETGENKLGSWYMYFGTNRISERLSIHSEIELLYYQNGKNFNESELVTGLNYHLGSAAITSIGYGYFNTDSSFEELPRESNIIEHRIFGQFILIDKVDRLDIQHRYRLEHRFLDFNPGFDTQQRIRYRIQLTLPVSKIIFLNFYDELFLNFQGNSFGQNRLYAAIGTKISKNLNVQSGYLKNHFNSAHFDRLQVSVTYNTDLRKKQRNNLRTVQK